MTHEPDPYRWRSIEEIEREAWYEIDRARYASDEAERMMRQTRERFEQEAHYIKAHNEHLMKLILDIEATKIRPITFIKVKDL